MPPARPRLQSRILGALLALGLAAVGYGAWISLGHVDPAARLPEGERLLAEGHLLDADDIARAAREADPTALGGYLLGIRVQRALHHRAETEKLLGEAYALAPSGFADLPLYVDHRLHGPDDPKKGLDALAFLDTHLARYPQDAQLVAEGRLVALAYLLDQPAILGAQREALRAQADAALAAFHIAGTGTTEQHYDRAQALLALGDVDGAIAAGRAGIAANTDKWVALVMHWALTTALLHRGEADAAWAEMEAIQRSLATWPGTHYGMGKPLVELMQLTAHVRFGRTLDPPADYAARLARLDDEEIRLQNGDAETRDLVRALLPALAKPDGAAALPPIDDLLTLVGRDRGCEMENRMIRPHTRAMLLVARGDVLAATGDPDGARTAYTQASALFPEDPWLAGKVGTVVGSLGP